MTERPDPPEAPRGPVAILLWGDVIEDYLEHLGLDFDDFAGRLTGGWLFGYVDALATAGVGAIVVGLSSRFDHAVRLRHRPTGAPIVGLPTPWMYRQVHRRQVQAAGGQPAGGAPRGLRYAIGPYAQTPVLALARLLRAERCSALLCQEYDYGRFDACLAAGALARVPVFGCFQGGGVHFGALERALRRPALRACAGLVVGSQAERRRIEERFGAPPQRIASIPNPCATGDLRPQPRAAARGALGIDQDDLVVAWHGRVEVERKGLDLLLDAWRAIRDGGLPRPPRLLLVGTGSGAPRLRQAITALGEADILWVDEYVLERERVGALLSAADVYAFPSRREGFPAAPIEAMACGLPVVAMAGSGIEAVIPDGEASGGILTPCENVAAFAAAVVRVLRDGTLRQQLAARARQRAEAGFGAERIGRDLAAFLARNGRR